MPYRGHVWAIIAHGISLFLSRDFYNKLFIILLTAYIHPVHDLAATLKFVLCQQKSVSVSCVLKRTTHTHGTAGKCWVEDRTGKSACHVWFLWPTSKQKEQTKNTGSTWCSQAGSDTCNIKVLTGQFMLKAEDFWAEQLWVFSGQNQSLNISHGAVWRTWMGLIKSECHCWWFHNRCYL